MKLEKSIYPYNPEARTLPFFLFGIGGSRFQKPIDRPEGYGWDQILFCAEGSGTLRYGENEIVINAGDCFFLPKNKQHSYYPIDTVWDIRWIAFEGSASDEVLKKFCMTEPVVITANDSAALEKIFDKMVLSQENDYLYCDHICSGLVYDYIIEFHRSMDSQADSERSRNISMLFPALKFMHDNFRSDISMTQLSDIIGITPQHFCRVFKKTMNARPNEFLTQIRLDEAKRLLNDKEITVSEAAERSGFKNAGYFSTVFRKYEGISPQQFKKSFPSL